MSILVCGGAGYIGSHMVKMLQQAGRHVVVFDDLSTGHDDMVGTAELVRGDLRDREALNALFRGRRFDAVMHFSARSLVAESVAKPALYYENNVTGTLNLLAEMARQGVDRFIFSSTAATYGNPLQIPIDEDHPTDPINPYGKSKLMVERILKDYGEAYGLRSVSFRYFNAAGADPDGELGERHDPETHLIPNILKSLLRNDGGDFQIFGDDYETPDGTCLRDYVHVNDICRAHLLGLDYLATQAGAHIFNLGSGSGYSNLEVMHMAGKVAGREVNFRMAPRRPGDPPVLVADSRRAREILGWQPAFENLEELIATAWNWHRRHG